MATTTVTAPRVLADALPRVRAHDAALVLAGALLTALCAQVSIPLPGDPVPLTGQTFAVLLTGAALGSRRGASAQGLYVGMGMVGLPVYADGEAGVDRLFGATGGYLVGFVVAAWVVGRAADAGLDRSPFSALPVFALGSLIIFAFGVAWLAVHQDIGVIRAIELGVVPFIPGGIVKAVAAAAALPAAWRLVGRVRR